MLFSSGSFLKLITFPLRRVYVAAHRLSLVAVSRGYSATVLWFLVVVAEPTGSWAPVVAARDLGSRGFQALELGLRHCGTEAECSPACGIFQDQGWSRCPPYW